MVLPSAVAFAWQPGTYPESSLSMASSGLKVDNTKRNDVVAFWHAVYQASEGYEKRIGWTGNYNGRNGGVSKDFVNDVERRINYFRAMCGVPAVVKLNTESKVLIESSDSFKPDANTKKSTAAQAAALMLIRNYNPNTGSDPAITHNPAPSLVGWTPVTWNANAHSDIAFGVFGPGAMTEYVVEEISNGSATSFWNTLVGHRRWILFPDATDFATGDQPGESAKRPPTNVLYISQRPGERVADPTPGFVAYPPPGFFPAPVNSRYWSFSIADADFTNAKVSVRNSSGQAVPVSNVQSNNSYGYPALVWEVSGAAASSQVFADATFSVKVTGVAGMGINTSYDYSVTLINPDRITSNQSIIGPSKPVSDQETVYKFTPPGGAEAMQVAVFKRTPATWIEDAEESTKSHIIDHTADSYPPLVDPATYAGFSDLSGGRSFNLTFPTIYDLIARGVPEQSLEIDRLIIPKSGATLSFLYRRGYMTIGSNLATEISSDGGVTWKTIGANITGKSNTIFDLKVSSATIDLPKSDSPIRIRFRYFCPPGVAIYSHEAAPTSPTGIFLDDIKVQNCDELEPQKMKHLSESATRYKFSSMSAGTPLVAGDKWCLALRTKLGGRWFPYGPMKAVTITAP